MTVFLQHNRINYFNFYGDIQVNPIVNFYGLKLQLGPSLSIGDGVLLPGSDNPQDTPFFGGARFCQNCGNQPQFVSSGSYSEWPMADPQVFNYDLLLHFLSILGPGMDVASALQVLGGIASAPELHTKITSSDSLGGTIKVYDATGKSSTGTASIAKEILWQIEKGDGILQ